MAASAPDGEGRASARAFCSRGGELRAGTRVPLFRVGAAGFLTGGPVFWIRGRPSRQLAR
jgi:hypothetical protein